MSKPTKRAPKPPRLSPLQTLIQKLEHPGRWERFFGYDTAEFDYDRTDCTGCSDYCRCTRIINAHITEINVDVILDNLTKDLDDVLLTYCVDRTARASKLLNKDSWEVDVQGGYYGDEANGVRLHDTVLSDLIQSLKDLEPLSDADRIKKVLVDEYGYLLPHLVTCTKVKVIQADLGQMEMRQDHYRSKIAKEMVDYYTDYKFPRAACTYQGTYTVIDGYHRMFSAQKQALKSVPIIVLEK
jgi:hypothetical protein